MNKDTQWNDSFLNEILVGIVQMNIDTQWNDLFLNEISEYRYSVWKRNEVVPGWNSIRYHKHCLKIAAKRKCHR